MLSDCEKEPLRETVHRCDNLIQLCAEITNSDKADKTDFEYMRLLVQGIALATRQFLLLTDTDYYEEKERQGGRTRAERAYLTWREVQDNGRRLERFSNPQPIESAS